MGWEFGLRYRLRTLNEDSEWFMPCEAQPIHPSLSLGVVRSRAVTLGGVPDERIKAKMCA